MNSTEELRRELEKGYRLPEGDDENPDSRASTVRMVIIVSLVSMMVLIIVAASEEVSLVTFLLSALLFIVLPALFIAFDDSATRKQKSERQQRIEVNPPKVELIDSIKSYQAFMKRERLVGKGFLAQARHISQLTRDIYDQKRSVVVKTEFLDGSDLPQETKKEIEWLKSSIENGVRHESNQYYSRTYRQVSGWSIVIMVLIGLMSWLLSECS
jgi:hypothetical protein